MTRKEKKEKGDQRKVALTEEKKAKREKEKDDNEKMSMANVV